MPLKDRPPRIHIQNVWPLLDCGRYPPKRSLGDTVEVWADVFRDGHDAVRARVLARGPGRRKWREAPMAPIGNDRWVGSFAVEELGRHQFTIEAWTDPLATWRDELARKVGGGQEDVTSELAEGHALLVGWDDAAARGLAETLGGDAPQDEKIAAALDPALDALIAPPADAVALPRPLELDVDRVRARFGSWYELFPRSWGGFRGVEAELPRLAELGFDVLYLPPIHPIGTTNRKGRNNALKARKGDVGSPWAIGSKEGGHTAIHPDLGTMDDFELLVRRGRELGVEVALDFAIQCSPDHPWLREHPEWFHRRPDGTLKYAENPPKRYQDIYNVNFGCDDWQELWDALRDVVLFWVERGVKAFRVDNPHTKPVAFWEWLIAEVHARDPEVIFLSEAFTRPRMMETLAKAGFSQSYTYFTWKNTKAELTGYMVELVHSTLPQFFRPNFFANTPDILHEYLQTGGRPAFEVRLVLAATLSPSYGIYSGYEHCENVPVREGSEEYLDSEKYEVKKRRLDGPLLPLVARLNAARRENPALQRLDNVTFLETENDHLLAYAKREGDNVVLVCANLDPHGPHEGVAVVPASLGLPPAFTVRDLLSDESYTWRTGRNFVRLDPAERTAHVLRPQG